MLGDVTHSRVVAQGGFKHSSWRPGGSSGISLDAQSVVHGDPEFLLASQLPLISGRLHAALGSST